MIFKRFAALAFAVSAPIALSGCLLLPGDFTADMMVKKSGEFSFVYKGQIQLVGLATLLNNNPEDEIPAEFAATCYVDPNEEADKKTKADTDKRTKRLAAATARKEKADTAKEAGLKDMKAEGKSTAASATAQEDYDEPAVDVEDANEAEGATTVGSVVEESTPVSKAEAAGEAAAKAGAEAAAEAAATASTDDSGIEERDCSKTEIAEQKVEWDKEQSLKVKRESEQKKILTMMLGGIDPKDPKTITRFTKEVERLAAWNKVEHLGNGLFKIDYATTGRLADDFAFPVIPRYSIGQPMIHITRWDNGRLRIEAPSFHNDPDTALMAMVGGGGLMGAMGGMGGGGASKAPEPVEVKGVFTIRTDASVIANNTDEGPVEEGGMQVLRWDIGPSTYGAPMALLKIGK